ncbi:type IV pilus biogenesis protein PilP [Citrobacter koseri]|uniref:type IV pilus biogenesis protein PilP n=1 Tax=Citrobacter koseri TaxID=545 RepID=UPI000DF10CD8|nr:type IV pilus biogenesis protein PilP [Citrobacter koseri]STB73761.1 type IV pilus biogenesis protein PilP [Citrobacter koseri]
MPVSHNPHHGRAALLLAAIMLATVSGGAPASDSTSSQVTPALTKGELEALNNRNILLQAQVQGAQLERQLKENRDGTPSATAPGSPAWPQVPGDSVNPPSARTGGRTTVLEITGRDRALRATLMLANGQLTTVTTGSRLPGSPLTVKSISLAGVMLSDGTTLTF